MIKYNYIFYILIIKFKFLSTKLKINLFHFTKLFFFLKIIFHKKLKTFFYINIIKS